LLKQLLIWSAILGLGLGLATNVDGLDLAVPGLGLVFFLQPVAGAVLALARWGAKGGTIPAEGAGGPQYAAELRIYWFILQLN